VAVNARVVFVCAGLIAGLGCGGGDSGPARGSEKGPCFEDGTCNTGLSCLSELCVAGASAAQALSDGIAFEGGVTRTGQIPKTTDDDVTLVVDDVSLLLDPGDTSPEPMSLTVDNPSQSDDPVDLTMIQFVGAEDHIEVKRPKLGKGDDPGKIALKFSLDKGVCARLCDTVFEIKMKQAVQLMGGGVGHHGTTTLSLDCRKRGDHDLCTGDELPPSGRDKDSGADPGSRDGGGAAPADSMLIGKAGGTVELADGASVVIPAGALSKDTMITVSVVPDPPALDATQMAAGEAYAFEPHGTAFAMPVTITLPFTGGAPDAQVMKLDDAKDTSWTMVSGAVASGSVLTLQSMGFSIYQATLPKSAGTGGTGGTGGSGGSGGTDGGTGDSSVSATPIVYNDPNMKCYAFRVHQDGDKTAPLSVPMTPDLYTEFAFDAPWAGTQYLRSLRYLKGNEAVIHHFRFFREDGGADGAVLPMATHAGGQLLHSWALGGSDVYYSPNLGQQMPATGYVLESHHNNMTGSSAADNTGLEVCVTTAVPTNIAAITRLGTDNIAGTSATGTCAADITTPVHILSGVPEMHAKGIHMKATINRAGGPMDVLYDQPFDSNNQILSPLDAVIDAGDTITTTCNYSSPASFGTKASDEVCYFFMLAYPAGVLQTTGIGSTLYGSNTCLP
jgi:hypothetical protein